MRFQSYLLVLNGALLPLSILREMALNSVIVALDGAANGLAALGIKPNIIIGDFDSVEENPEAAQVWGIKKGFNDLKEKNNHFFDEPYIGNFDVMIVHTKNPNFTDFQKALKFIKQDVHLHNNYQKPDIIHVASAPGMRMDHELSNIFTLKKEYSKNCPIYMHREYHSLQYVENSTVLMKGEHHDYCGIFGFPNATMSVKNKGLEYGDIEPYSLSLRQHSSSNRIIGNNNAELVIEGEALLVHPPMFAAQRQFFKKSREEQLLELLQDSRMALYPEKASECKRALDTLSNTSNKN